MQFTHTPSCVAHGKRPLAHASGTLNHHLTPLIRCNWCRPPSEHGPGDATPSGRYEASARRVAAAAVGDGFGAGDSYGAGGGQFSRFREFQRRASAAAGQEQQQSGERGAAADPDRPGGAGPSWQGTQRRRPYSKWFWRQLPNAWFARPDYTPATLYQEILRRCEKNTCGVDALYMICKLAGSPEEARIALGAFAAVRASLVRQGKVAPFNERLAVAFARMIRTADAPDVLVEALRRASELGLLLSAKQLHELLRHWGEAGELAKIEEVLAAMPLGGVPYNHVTAYIVIRTAVNLGAQDKAEYYANAMMQRQIRLKSSAVRLLELGRQRQREAQAAAAALAAAAAAAQDA